MGKSQTNATNVTLYLHGQSIWRDIWKRIVEKSQTNATNVTLHPIRQVIWGHIWKRTVEKSQTNATNVTMHPLGQTFSSFFLNFGGRFWAIFASSRCHQNKNYLFTNLLTVRFQMFPQMACLRGCIVTSVAFVWLFPTVRFRMCPQSSGIKECIITLATCIFISL